MFINEYLTWIDQVLENIVLEKLFSHLLLKNVLPPYFQNL
jgi:hypothetical protein